MMYWEANVMSHPHVLSLLASVMIFPFMVWGQPWWFASWMPTLPLKFPEPYCHLPSDAFNFHLHFSAHWPLVICVLHWTLSVLVTEGCGYFEVHPDLNKQLYFASLHDRKNHPKFQHLVAAQGDSLWCFGQPECPYCLSDKNSLLISKDSWTPRKVVQILAISVPQVWFSCSQSPRVLLWMLN